MLHSLYRGAIKRDVLKKHPPNINLYNVNRTSESKNSSLQVYNALPFKFWYDIALHVHFNVINWVSDGQIMI